MSQLHFGSNFDLDKGTQPFTLSGKFSEIFDLSPGKESYLSLNFKFNRYYRSENEFVDKLKTLFYPNNKELQPYRDFYTLDEWH